MADKKLMIDSGPDSAFTVAAGKQKTLLKLEGPGVITAIYHTITQRTVELQIIADEEQTDLPSLTKINTMKLIQTATLGYAGMKIWEYNSTTPFGFAFEHPIEFDKSLEIVVSNEAGATATLGDYIVIWEKHKVSG